MAKKTKYLMGEVFENHLGQKYEIIGYVNDDYLRRKIRFIKTGYEKVVLTSSLRNNKIRDCLEPSILGVGILGFEKATKHILFDRWLNMIGRCYYEKHAQYKNYGAKGVMVSEELKNFKKYIEVVEGLENYELLKKYPSKYQVDKDILSNGNKIYSKETLKIVTMSENIEEENKNRRFKIDRYDLSNNYIDSFNSISEAEKITGIHRGNIARNVRGEGRTAGGYVWKRSC